ncbi:MAG: DoxX family protein [Xanthobacteraceae bacterium]
MLERLRPSAEHDRGNLGPLAFGLGPTTADSILLLARILIGYIFVLGGWGKLTGLAGFASYLETHGVPASYPVAVLGAAVEFFGGIALITGLATRYVVLLIVAFTLVATGIAHRFWEFEPPARRGQTIHFNKNMAMIGGLLALFVAGPGRFSIDGLLARRRT